MTHLTQLADRLKTITLAYCETVPVPIITGLITDETPMPIADRLGVLVEDYPAGVPVELVDIERRRVSEFAHMVAEGLVE
jgi:hypothetical protein